MKLSEEDSDILEEILKVVPPIDLIQIGCSYLGWSMAVQNTNQGAGVEGLIIGEEDWIEDHTLDIEEFDIVSFELEEEEE